MTSYVALLRGVNVGGVTIKMADLAAVFRSLGFEQVRTVLASGNVVFDADGTASELRSLIEEALRERFGYEAHVHVIDSARLRAVVDAYPLPARAGWHRYVLFFLDGIPEPALLQAAGSHELETITAGEGVIYWTVERGNTLDSPFGKALGGRFRANTTNRNVNTLEKLLR